MEFGDYQAPCWWVSETSGRGVLIAYPPLPKFVHRKACRTHHPRRDAKTKGKHMNTNSKHSACDLKAGRRGK